LTDKHDPIAKREHDLQVIRHKKRLTEIKESGISIGNKGLTSRKYGELHDY